MKYTDMDPVGPSSSIPVPNEENHNIERHLLICVPDYLEKKLYPEGSSKALKFSIRRKAKLFTLNGGLLYYVGKNASMNPRQVVFNADTKKRIIRQCHEGDGDAHFGRDKSVFKIESTFYWPNMFCDMKSYINSCGRMEQIPTFCDDSYGF